MEAGSEGVCWSVSENEVTSREGPGFSAGWLEGWKPRRQVESRAGLHSWAGDGLELGLGSSLLPRSGLRPVTEGVRRAFGGEVWARGPVRGQGGVRVGCCP